MKKILLILLTLICSLGYSQNLGEIEKHLLNLVNKERSERGLTTFITDTLINNGAKIQADYLCTVRTIEQISHSNPNPIHSTSSKRVRVASDLKYSVSNENITAFGYESIKTDLEIAQTIHNNFMNSKFHKMNVLREIVDIFNEGWVSPVSYGHSVVYDKSKNLIIAVQLFPTENFHR